MTKIQGTNKAPKPNAQYVNGTAAAVREYEPFFNISPRFPSVMRGLRLEKGNGKVARGDLEDEFISLR